MAVSTDPVSTTHEANEKIRQFAKPCGKKVGEVNHLRMIFLRNI